jgi:hypothetical protein
MTAMNPFYHKQWAKVEGVKCPRCGRGGYKKCVTVNGYDAQEPHAARLRLARGEVD